MSFSSNLDLEGLVSFKKITHFNKNHLFSVSHGVHILHTDPAGPLHLAQVPATSLSEDVESLRQGRGPGKL